MGEIYCCNLCCGIESLVFGDNVLWCFGVEIFVGIFGVVEVVEVCSFVLVCLDYYDGFKFVVVNVD